MVEAAVSSTRTRSERTKRRRLAYSTEVAYRAKSSTASFGVPTQPAARHRSSVIVQKETSLTMTQLITVILMRGGCPVTRSQIILISLVAGAVMSAGVCWQLFDK